MPPAARLAGAPVRREIADLGDALVMPLLTGAVFLFCCHLWRLGDVNITFSDTLFFAVLGLELGLARLNGLPFGPLSPIWAVSLALMLGGLFLGSVVNGDPLRWLIVAAQYLFSFLLLPMMLIRDQRTLDRLVLAIVFGVVTMESVGIAAYCLLSGFRQANALFGPDFITGGRRLGSFVGDANWNSAVIAMALPFVLYAARRGLVKPFVALAAASILLWALMLAASFTGFSAAVLAGGIMMVAARVWPSPRMIAAVCLGLTLLVASGYQLPAIFEKRVAPALQTGNIDDAGTYQDRAALIAEAWVKAKDTVFVGMGVDQYRKFSAFQQPVHNMYMLELVEGGAPALAGWLGLVAILIALPLRRLQARRLEAALCLAVTAVFLTFSMASPHMYARLWTVPLLVSLGLVIVPRGRRADTLGPASSPELPRR
jgi:O-antigen ligase